MSRRSIQTPALARYAAELRRSLRLLGIDAAELARRTGYADRTAHRWVEGQILPGAEAGRAIEIALPHAGLRHLRRVAEMSQQIAHVAPDADPWIVDLAVRGAA